MQGLVLDKIGSTLPVDDLIERLHVRLGTRWETELRDIIREAESVGRPRAYCGESLIEERGDDYVVLDGIRFTSRVLVVNTEKSTRVFPFLATCGTELEEWSKGFDNIVHRYWTEEIRIAAMKNAVSAVSDYLTSKHDLGKHKPARMAPGEFEDWPLEEQRPLFELLGDTEGLLGVRLTESLMMIPTKTTSGVFLPAAHGFEACMLCTQLHCTNRQAPYDPDLFNSRFRKEEGKPEVVGPGAE